MPIRKERVLSLVINYIFFAFAILMVSCKTLSKEKHMYNVINAALSNLADKDSIYLNPFIITIDDKKRKEIKIYGIDTQSCYSLIEEISSTYISKETVRNEWNYSKIENQNIITELKIKNVQSIERYNKIAEKTEDKQALIARKFMFWNAENGKSMVQLSYPLFNKAKNLALVYCSKYNDGEFVLLMESKTKENWEVICTKRLSHY